MVRGGRLAASLLPLVYSLFLRYGARVRKPTAPEQLYIDFDGFFAACEEQADHRLQGRPLGVIPFAGAVHSCVIAANTMAKRAGVTTGMAIADARRRCPGIALVPQQPDLYTRIHHRIVAAVLDVLPIDAVCSIDEFAATVEPRDIPAALTHQITQRLRDAVGDHITCSIGYAPNRWLAKIAADLDKPDGLTVLHPRDLPGRLLTLDLEDVPGVATRMRTRLARGGLTSVEDLWQADPLQLRAAWGSVTGVRLWYALHGYAVAPPRTQRRSIGHGRVLPPGQRQASAARIVARQLVVKAARRMRREGYLAQRLTLSVDCLDAPYWTAAVAIAAANDDRAGLEALAGLWAALGEARPQVTLFRLTVSFDRFRPTDAVQLELPWRAPDARSRVVRLTAAVDAINSRYGRTRIGYGQCGEPGGYVGADRRAGPAIGERWWPSKRAFTHLSLRLVASIPDHPLGRDRCVLWERRVAFVMPHLQDALEPLERLGAVERVASLRVVVEPGQAMVRIGLRGRWGKGRLLSGDRFPHE